MTSPRPTGAIEALPLVRPFVAPEELARRAGHATLLRLGANESAFGPPPAALAAMRAALPSTSLYGDPESMELREALAQRHRCGVENVSVGAGIDDLLGLVVRTYHAPGDVTVATRGTYPTYGYHVAGYGARLETVPYAADGRVQLGLLAAHARDTQAKSVYLANPDNPSGAFAARADVAALRDALPERCLLVLDEAYADFVMRDDLLAETFEPNVVRLRTFSKAYGLAGARLAYALAAPGTVAAFDKVRLQYGVNRLAQIGALAALDDERFVSDVVAEVARGRNEYATLGRRLGISTLPSHTNFVCFDVGSRERAEAMLDELLRRGVFVRKPSAAPLEGHIRVTVGTADERHRFAAIFEEALAALGDSLRVAR